MDMLVGYARVSTLDQNPQMQIDALKQAGCERLYVEKASGAHRDRPELKAALAYMRPGDTLVVWRLSRLARSLKQIIETAHELEQKKQALKVLTRNIDTGTPEGRLFFHITAAFDEFQRELIVENGYPLHTTNWGAIVGAWKAQSIRSQALTILGRSRSSTSGSVARPSAGSMSGACVGRTALFARSAE